MDIVLQYGIRNQICDILDFWEEPKFLIYSGNYDLLEYIFTHFSYAMHSTPSERILAELVFESIIFGQNQIFEFLLQNGAEINQTGFDGSYPILAATRVFGRNPFFFHQLIVCGIDFKSMPDRGFRVLDVLIRQTSGAEAIKVIFAKEPDLVHICNPETGLQILHRAILYGHTSTVQALLEAGADLTKLSRSEGGYSTLEAAVFLPRLECLENLKLLLSIESRMLDSETPQRLGSTLLEACARGNSAAVELLLQSNANPYFTDDEAIFKRPIGEIIRDTQCCMLQ